MTRHARVKHVIDTPEPHLARVGHMLERVGVSRRRGPRAEYANQPENPRRRSPMNTRTIAIAALVIAVILLIIFLA